MSIKLFKKVALSTVMVAGASLAFADDIRKDAFEERIPIPAQEVPAQEVAVEDDCGGFHGGLWGGAPVWFFDNEDTNVGGGVYADASYGCMPLNFRVGTEVRHMDLEQEAAQSSAEWPGKTVEATFVRIPFSVEYKQTLDEGLDWFAGLGPDIIRVANDVSDTTVGLHLSTRLTYDIAENVGVGVEAGYMWAEAESEFGDNIDLDTAFITPQIGVKF